MAETRKYTIFVDPTNLDDIVKELNSCGATNIELGSGGPSAAIFFTATEEDIKDFIDYTAFEITKDDIA